MNTRDLGIGAGKGDKSRVTSVEVFRERFPENLGRKRAMRMRSSCCEAPFTFCGEWFVDKEKTMWWRCMACQQPCDQKVFEIS